jgi:hypothetical protein
MMPSLSLALALAAPMAAGYALSGWLRAGPEAARPSPLLRASLGLGWGLGASSCLFFAWLLLAGSPGRAYVWADLVLFVDLAVVAAVATRSRGGQGGADGRLGGLPRFVRAVLVAALVASLGEGIALFVLLSRRFPHGAWDAWSIWNLRARFLYRAGDDWTVAFHPSLMATHLDYPLLIPTSVVRCWVYEGRETTTAPALVAFAFAIATVGLLVSSLSALRARSQGMLGGLVLMGTPLLFELGSNQFADVPLAYYILATAVAMAMGDRAPGSSRWSATAGMMAGFASWTKNEGMLFLVAVLAARLVAVAAARGWRASLREAVAFAIGAAPIVAVVAAFKARFAPPSDFLAAQGPADVVAKLADPSRYVILAETAVAQVAGPGGDNRRLLDVVAAIVVLAAYRLLLGGAPRRPGEPGASFAAIALALMVAGYVAAYVATPLHLPWHVRYSLSRLVVHLWPLAVFTAFLATASPEEALGRR